MVGPGCAGRAVVDRSLERRMSANGLDHSGSIACYYELSCSRDPGEPDDDEYHLHA